MFPSSPGWSTVVVFGVDGGVEMETRVRSKWICDRLADRMLRYVRAQRAGKPQLVAQERKTG